MLRESLAIRIKAIPDDWRRFSLTRACSAGHFSARGDPAEAEPLVVGGYQGMKAREARINASDQVLAHRGRGNRVVRLYRAWDKPDQAAAWAARLGLPDLPADVFAR